MLNKYVSPARQVNCWGVSYIKTIFNYLVDNQ